MWVGFAVRHAAKKLAIVGGILVGAVLSTRSGQRIAKVTGRAVKAAVTEGMKAINETKPGTEETTPKSV